jgi:hypothetical protein
MQVCLEHFHRNVYGAAADNPGSEIGRSGTPFFGGLTVMSLSLAENGDLTANRNRFPSERPDVSNRGICYDSNEQSVRTMRLPKTGGRCAFDLGDEVRQRRQVRAETRTAPARRRSEGHKRRAAMPCIDPTGPASAHPPV